MTTATNPDVADVADRSAPSGRPAPRRRSALTGTKLTMVALVTPSIVLLVLINAYPFIYAAFQSLHNGSLISSGPYVGFKNYSDTLTSDAFWQAARFTLLFTVVGVFGSWAIGLAMALLLRTDIPGASVFKVLLLLPWVVPVVVSATSINYLVATPTSFMPKLFDDLGLGSPLFLANPTWAKIVVCIYKVWISFPFMMLMCSAALASVDNTVYEAARVDGASAFQAFRLITLPIIARPTYISWILMTIFCVNDFPTIYLLTGGGPISATTSLVVLAYRVVFQNFQVGQGVSIAFIMTLTLVIISVLLYRQIRKAHV
jgi:multiple sugar transport system permease protein